ncbi:MAG: hypothetical protein OHK0047_36130 [Leptolyngbyaceae cyanobacterium]
MHYPASMPSLFTQLQNRFPSSTLVTELIQVQEGQYVVRALVQAGGTILTTAMAAAPTIEQAEDRARVRVLAVLGIAIEAGGTALPDRPSLLNGPNSRHQSFETESRFSLPIQAASPAEVRQEEQPPLPTYNPLETITPLATGEDFDFSEQVTEPPEGGSEEFSEVYDSNDEYAVQEFPLPIPEPSPRSVTNKTSSKPPVDRPAPAKPAKPEPAIAPTPEESEDLSSLIALTDIEMDRIGWTKQEGRDYLKRTYRKSTRQKLEVDELMDFLNYLRALPSANGL